MSHLRNSFRGDTLEPLAKSSRFIERSSSRLSGKMFLGGIGSIHLSVFFLQKVPFLANLKGYDTI